MLAEKVCDFGLDRLGEKGTCPVAQDFCELIVEDSWLNQMDDVIVGHGISLLRWRSGGVKHPHDMPPFRFPPSPTLGDSSSDLPSHGRSKSPGATREAATQHPKRSEPSNQLASGAGHPARLVRQQNPTRPEENSSARGGNGRRLQGVWVRAAGTELRLLV